MKRGKQLLGFAGSEIHPLLDSKRFHLGMGRLRIDKSDCAIGRAEVDANDKAAYLLLKNISSWITHA
jgi:hypothetical protein